MAVEPSIVVLTGAGVSADSGVPTFRDANGLWHGHRIEDVATPAAWRRDPLLVWRFYQARRASLAGVRPNAAHAALAAFEAACERAGLGFLLVTQNVDDLHERAGSRPVHMHGELLDLRCERCGKVRRDAAHFEPDAFVPCESCSFERLRPDVVWFDEVPYHLERIGAAIEACTHFLAIGTSGVVHPAAGLLHLARGLGARTLVQGLEAPENLHPADRFVRGRAAEAVPRLLSDLGRELGLPYGSAP